MYKWKCKLFKRNINHILALYFFSYICCSFYIILYFKKSLWHKSGFGGYITERERKVTGAMEPRRQMCAPPHSNLNILPPINRPQEGKLLLKMVSPSERYLPWLLSLLIGPCQPDRFLKMFSSIIHQ